MRRILYAEMERFEAKDGTIKRTKVSRGSGEIHPHMWREILRKQLQVTEEYFNKMI